MMSCVHLSARCWMLLMVLVCGYAEAGLTTITYENINTGAKQGEEAAWSYVTSHTSLLKSGGGLDLVDKKQSLLGTHYTFQQQFNGVPIEDAEVVVSVKDSDHTIFRVANTSISVLNKLSIDDSAKISPERAYDIAWKDLAVTGPLMSAPSTKLVYLASGTRLDLVYKVNLAVSEPFGYWQYTISAVSGKILNKEDTRLTRISKTPTQKPFSRGGPLLNRTQEFDAFYMRLFQKALTAAEEETTVKADGSALVFDPDPRTTLQDSTLQDDSPADKFERAYMMRTLKDLTVSANKYTLIGPWVRIEDFEPPNTAPSTTVDGKWNAKRGNNAFNDAMTYFHIDQNQRYMQSLGFVGNKGIQNRSIPADSDGVYGDDNSHFIPGTNRIAFGHGCVDDNEDADVILHEYGHAIQFSINSSWHGGDTGAMGEGFGDYWAQSYSYSRPNGLTYAPDRVFQFDGHGKCWPGRSVNVENAIYDPNRTYGAHSSVGSYQSDELWSTPLVQSLKELMAQGYPRDRVDQIILEAHFGLGANVKMRDMANAIVRTARALHPNDRYAAVFQKHFVKHNILELPHPVLEIEKVEVRNAGVNNVLDPGETVELYVTVRNTGTLVARTIKAKASSPNTNAALSSDDPAFADIEPGASVTNTLPIMVGLAKDATCGDAVEVTLDLTLDGGSVTTSRLQLKLPTGVAKGASLSVQHTPPLEIPDNYASGALSKIEFSSTEVITDKTVVTVPVEIIHNYIADLKVTLISPSGKEVVLHNHGGSFQSHDLVGTYPTTLTPVESLSKLVGEPLNGVWTLKVADTSAYDKGTLKSWGMSAVLGYQCEAH